MLGAVWFGGWISSSVLGTLQYTKMAYNPTKFACHRRLWIENGQSYPLQSSNIASWIFLNGHSNGIVMKYHEIILNLQIRTFHGHFWLPLKGQLKQVPCGINLIIFNPTHVWCQEVIRDCLLGSSFGLPQHPISGQYQIRSTCWLLTLAAPWSQSVFSIEDGLLGKITHPSKLYTCGQCQAGMGNEHCISKAHSGEDW